MHPPPPCPFLLSTLLPVIEFTSRGAPSRYKLTRNTSFHARSFPMRFRATAGSRPQPHQPPTAHPYLHVRCTVFISRPEPYYSYPYLHVRCTVFISRPEPYYPYPYLHMRCTVFISRPEPYYPYPYLHVRCTVFISRPEP